MNAKVISNHLDIVIIWMLILSVLIFRYLGLTSRVNILILVLIIVSIFLNIVSYLKDGSIVCLLAFSGYLVYNFHYLGGSLNLFLYNIFQIAPSILSIIYIFHTLRERKDFTIRFLNERVLLFNIYLYICIPFILLQASGQYWLAGATNGNSNSLGVDLISGLFGFNGTPMLALFVAFIMIFNYDYYRYQCRKKQKSLFVALSVPLFLFYNILPLLNDNKAYYLVLLIFLFLYFIAVKFDVNKSRSHLEINAKRIGILLTATLLFSILFIVLLQIQPIRTIFEKIIKEVKQGWEYGSKSHGSNERIGMIQFALSDGNHSLRGYGIGRHSWAERYLFGFWHYGQSDLGTFLCLGGILFSIFLFILIFILSKGIIESTFYRILIVSTFFILAIYTQVFTVMSLTVSALLVIILCVSGYSHSSERELQI